jgi:hypothetical protein
MNTSNTSDKGKIKRWEKIAMTLGALLTICVLFYFKTTNDQATRRHEEVMDRLAGNNVSLLETNRAYYKLLQTLDGDNKSIFDLLKPDGKARQEAIAKLRANWRKDDQGKLIELLTLSQNTEPTAGLIDLLQSKTKENLGTNVAGWHTWLWRQAAPADNNSYSDFKAVLYHQVDPLYLKTFIDHPKALVRLDEIEWSGVRKDSVPELCNPAVCSAKEAGFLHDDDIVFGYCDALAARCFPKRIVVWHQIIEDIVGQHNITLAYCPISGSTAIYDNIPTNLTYQFSNSGFNYRSNQLMQDHNTSSLWSTLDGSAVLGKAAERKVRLSPLPMVTTTWGEWRRRHPSTTVLSINTDFERDYNGPDFYAKYASGDSLMFPIIGEDRRLRNKELVFIPRFTETVGSRPLAISCSFLTHLPLYQSTCGTKHFLVLTDSSGANRLYQIPPNQKFTNFDGGSALEDSLGRKWLAGEDSLALQANPAPAVNTDKSGDYKRLPATTCFWFAWFAAHPDTKLVL